MIKLTAIFAIVIAAALSAPASTTNIINGIAFVVAGSEQSVTDMLDAMAIGSSEDDNDTRLAELGRVAVVDAVSRLVADYNQSLIDAAVESARSSASSNAVIIVVE